MPLIQRLRELTIKDLPLLNLLKVTSQSFIIKLLAALATFSYSVVIARTIGLSGAGQYFLGFSVVSFAIIIGKFGIDKLLLRSISKNKALENWADIKGTISFGIGNILLASILTTFVTYSCSKVLAINIFKQENLINVFELFSIAIIPIALIYALSEIFKGLGRVPFGLSLYGFWIPTLAIVLLGVAKLLSYQLDVNIVIYTYIASSILVLFASLIVLFFELKKQPTVTANYPERKVFYSTSSTFFQISSYQYLLSFSSVFFLGIWATDESVALFSIAKRIAMILLMFHVAFTSAIAPKLGAYFAKNDIYQIERLCKKMTLIICLAFMPVFFLLIAFPEPILLIFGNDFIEANWALRILLIGQFVNIALGPVGQILTQGGKEKQMRKSLIIATLITIALNISLIPFLGLIGAALASTITLIIHNILMLTFVKKEFGFYTLPFMKQTILK